MLGQYGAFATAEALGMLCDLASGMKDSDPTGTQFDMHRLTDQPPRHAVRIALDFDAAIGLYTPLQ